MQPPLLDMPFLDPLSPSRSSDVIYGSSLVESVVLNRTCMRCRCKTCVWSVGLPAIVKEPSRRPSLACRYVRPENNAVPDFELCRGSEMGEMGRGGFII